jgi:phosphate transport system protein
MRDQDREETSSTVTIHLTRDLAGLHHDLLLMCAKVEEIIHAAVAGLAEPSESLAHDLAAQDDEIDRWDVRIEEECLKILALHQPVAVDLRRITTVMKIANELERVADLGVHIAERACAVRSQPDLGIMEKLKLMAGTALDMLHRSIDAYVDLDSRTAREICQTDSVVDEWNVELIAALHETMRQSPALIDSAMHLFSASRHIERVADHATNIAEDVVYLVEGKIIRHRRTTVE